MFINEIGELKSMDTLRKITTARIDKGCTFAKENNILITIF